jgi:hypothetical protein
VEHCLWQWFGSALVSNADPDSAFFSTRIRSRTVAESGSEFCSDFHHKNLNFYMKNIGTERRYCKRSKNIPTKTKFICKVLFNSHALMENSHKNAHPDPQHWFMSNKFDPDQEKVFWIRFRPALTVPELQHRTKPELGSAFTCPGTVPYPE